MSVRPPLDPGLPYEEEFRRRRAELWTPTGAPDWQRLRREAAAWLVGWKEAGEDLTERTEQRIARDEARLRC